MRTRRDANQDASSPICVFDLAESIGIEVKFAAISSMEGTYVRSARPTIVVPSQRPSGRQAFGCAHELGHHVFGHGTRIDKCLSEDGRDRAYDADEWIADLFAAHLLMPKAAVARAFRIRGWDVGECSAEQVFVVAGQLGVGYTTLITQMRDTLKMVQQRHAAQLLRHSPKDLRQSVLGYPARCNVVVVDEKWEKRPVDVQVGDRIMLPGDSQFEGQCLRSPDSDHRGKLVEAATPGVGRAWIPEGNWATWIRVSRREFVGRGCFRHLEDPDDDTCTTSD
jgi:Zn-dependent peptidase ImmA (M78 family)